MTICIAAIGTCDEELGTNGEAIVFVTDHMVTISEVGQFEHSIEKYRKINSNTIAMLAGEALLFDDVLENVPNCKTLNTMKETIHNNMVKIRDKEIKKEILDKFKVDFKFLKEMLKNPQHNTIVTEILNDINEWTLETSIILAGFDGDKAQIIEIDEIGTTNTRDINFDAIGTGAIQAFNTLLFQRHSKTNNIKTTLYNVYKAKEFGGC